VRVDPVAGSTTNFTISGLDAVTATPGNYQLTGQLPHDPDQFCAT
jgi:hypothetical protein